MTYDETLAAKAKRAGLSLTVAGEYQSFLKILPTILPPEKLADQDFMRAIKGAFYAGAGAGGSLCAINPQALARELVDFRLE
jgi:hypothetical protein